MNYSLLYSHSCFSEYANLSIIIPSYKPEKNNLKTCLSSILTQKFSSGILIEVLIILNGNQDPYLGWITSIVADLFENSNYINVYVYYTGDKGVSNARNIGIEESSSDNICFIDDDDWISDNYVSEIYSLILLGKFPLATMIDIIDGKEVQSYYGKLFDKLTGKTELRLMDIRSWFSLPVMKIFKKEDIGNHRFNTKLSNGEDGLFVFDVLNPKLNFSLTSDKAIYYRRVRSNSLVGSLKSKGLFERLFHATHLSTLYFIHYFKYGCKYNIIFLGTRILAPFRHVIK